MHTISSYGTSGEAGMLNVPRTTTKQRRKLTFHLVVEQEERPLAYISKTSFFIHSSRKTRSRSDEDYPLHRLWQVCPIRHSKEGNVNIVIEAYFHTASFIS